MERPARRQQRDERLLSRFLTSGFVRVSRSALAAALPRGLHERAHERAHGLARARASERARAGGATDDGIDAHVLTLVPELRVVLDAAPVRAAAPRRRGSFSSCVNHSHC